jgi:Icc-related predicted phosphoesterase
LVVLAGDIGVGKQGVAWAMSVFDVPVLYVPGNHEYYGRSLDALDDTLRDYCADSHVRVLQNNRCVIGGVRFVGATLWTDFTLFGETSMSQSLAKDGMNDYRLIGHTVGRRALPSDTLALHQASRIYLEKALAEPFSGTTVVITHHAPSIRSVAPRYRQDPLTPCYASPLDSLVASSGAVLWIHGHVHDLVDYTLGNTRVVANPKGYPGELGRESGPFDWNFTLDLPR